MGDKYGGKGYRCAACHGRIKVFRGDRRVKYCGLACKREGLKASQRRRYDRRKATAQVREINLAGLAIEEW